MDDNRYNTQYDNIITIILLSLKRTTTPLTYTIASLQQDGNKYWLSILAQFHSVNQHRYVKRWLISSDTDISADYIVPRDNVFTNKTFPGVGILVRVAKHKVLFSEMKEKK